MHSGGKAVGLFSHVEMGEIISLWQYARRIVEYGKVSNMMLYQEHVGLVSMLFVDNMSALLKIGRLLPSVKHVKGFIIGGNSYQSGQV